MKVYRVKIQGTTPLMQHRMPEDELFALLGTKTAKKKDKEVSTPREIAERYVYRDKEGNCVIPTCHIVGAFKTVASEYKQKNSVRKSMKSIAGGIFRPTAEYCPILVKGKPTQKFEVDVRKATNHQKGAIAVCRPRFDEWETELDVTIDDSLISPEIVLDMLNDSGKRSGIGSFRVARGGYFGQFQCVGFEEMKD